MAVGKQDETVIVMWHPGESTGSDGSGITVASVPTSDNVGEAVQASGVRSFLDTRIDNEITARTAVNTRVSTLSTRIVASGVLPTGV